MSGYKPTCELRIAQWIWGQQKIERLQQKWVSDFEGEKPEWRNVQQWFMPISDPTEDRWPA